MNNNILYKEMNIEKKMERVRNKRGQVTIFLILALVIVSVVIAYFLWMRPTGTSDVAGVPRFESCVRDAIEQQVILLSASAGVYAPEFTYPYQGQHYTYLCYTNEYYKLCTVQQPLLKQTFENSLETATRESLASCYEQSLEDLRSQGYGVSSGQLSYNISLDVGSIRVDLDAPVIVGSQQFRRFSFDIPSTLYDTVMIATSVVQSEAEFGDTEVTDTMLYYPEYRVEKLKQGDGTTLYILQYQSSMEVFRFASRSLAWPPGYA